jgi:hypothetical protein
MTFGELEVVSVSPSEHSSLDPAASPCPGCERLEERVQELLVEHESLVKALARERERANALFLAYPPQVATPSHVPMSAPQNDVPMRYRVVDSLNENFKRRLPGIHRFARRAISFVRAAALE